MVGEIAARVSAEFGRTVSAGNVEYLLENKLTPLGLVAGGEDAAQPATAGPDAAILALRLRGTLIPEAGVQVVARLFGPLFLPPVVVVVLGLLAVADVWLVRSGGLLAAFGDVLARPLLLLVLVGLAAVSMVFHECGHAAACRYGGARPGRIGMGLYVLWPALFTNVTDSYRLVGPPDPDRPGRGVLQRDLRGGAGGRLPKDRLPAAGGGGAAGPAGDSGAAAAHTATRRVLHPDRSGRGAGPVPEDRAGATQPGSGPATRSPGGCPAAGLPGRPHRVGGGDRSAAGRRAGADPPGYPPAGHRVRAVHDRPGGRHDSPVRPGRGRGRAGSV